MPAMSMHADPLASNGLAAQALRTPSSSQQAAKPAALLSQPPTCAPCAAFGLCMLCLRMHDLCTWTLLADNCRARGVRSFWPPTLLPFTANVTLDTPGNRTFICSVGSG